MTDQTPSGYLEVAHGRHAVLVQVVGLGNMHSAASMADFVDAELENGFPYFIVDLHRCLGMDSTFMGTLVGLSAKVGERKGALCLVNVKGDLQKLMEMIGIWTLMSVQGELSVQGLETACILPDQNTTRRLEQIHRAHEILVSIDERNQERFGFFLECIEKEMSTHRATSGSNTSSRINLKKRDSEILRQDIFRHSGKQLPRTFDDLFYGDLNDLDEPEPKDDPEDGD